MIKEIKPIVAYPFDAQDIPFFCALSSALLPALDYTEETPYFCMPNERFCNHCGGCNKTTLQKHHLGLYHVYQTFTGVSLGWEWPEHDSPYQVIPDWEPGWRWPDAFMDFIFGYAGLSWKRLQKGASKEEVFAAIQSSIDAGIPALLRLGMDWRVATGYGDNAELFGLGYKLGGAAAMPEWFASFEDAVLITGRVPQKVAVHDVLERMIQTLSHPAHARLEADLMAKIDGVTPANARETAEWLLGKVGFPIEARWHAAESGLPGLCGNEGKNHAAWDKAFGMLRQYIFDDFPDSTHGTCWKIWAQLGVGPKTNYKLPEDAADRLLKPETQAELKRMFAIVLENDRVVLGLLRETNQLVR